VRLHQARVITHYLRVKHPVIL